MTSNAAETDEDDSRFQYDDEDEEEQEQSNTDDEQNELNQLQANANTPLDEILRLYSNNPPIVTNNISQHNEDSYSSSEIEDDDDEDGDEDSNPRHHLLHMNGELLPDDDDAEDSLYEPDITRFINVGDQYQAQIESKAEFDSSNEDCDDREVPVDELLWSSSCVHDSNTEIIEEYLKKVHTEYPSSDDEISLQTLLKCQFNSEIALNKFRQLSAKTIYSYPAWSLTEIEKFEEGLIEYGKNFFKIAHFKCSNRSVREVVHFYYQWKKSERYHSFIEEQRRISSLASVSDIIGKFIEEQEHHLCSAAGVDNSESSSAFISNDFKFHAPISTNPSISFVTLHEQETTSIESPPATTKRTFDQVDSNDDGTPSKKTSISTKTSSSETATTTIV